VDSKAQEIWKSIKYITNYDELYKHIQYDISHHGNLFNTSHDIWRSVMSKKVTQQVEVNGQIPTVPINYDLYKPQTFGKYVPMGNELDMLKSCLEDGLPFLMEGEKGTGKTMAVTEMCAKEGASLVSFSCSSGTTMGDILGREHLYDGNSVFQLGVLPIAILTANLTKKAVLYLDELNALDPEVQKMLNPVIDDRRSIVINNTLYKLDDNVQFTIIATQNPSYYSGVNPLNEDLRSRFVGKVIEYPTTSQITKVIDWTDIPEEEVGQPLLSLAVDTLSMKKESKIDYVISVRDISLFTRLYRSFLKNPALSADPEQALRMAIECGILIKYSDAEEREVVRARAQDTFGVNV
jgi:MoxR-like ATPase